MAIRSGAAGGIERSEVRGLKVSTIRHSENESTPAGYEESVDANIWVGALDNNDQTGIKNNTHHGTGYMA